MRQEGVELVVGFCWSLCSLVRRIAYSKRVSKTSLPVSQSVSQSSRGIHFIVRALRFYVVAVVL